MNFKVAAGILAGVLVGLGLGFLLSHRSTAGAPNSRPESQVSVPAAPNSQPTPPVVSPSNAVARPTTPATGPKQPDIETALKDIQKDFDSGDAAAVADLLLKLEHPERQVRKAALDTLVQVDDRKAAPRLKELAASTEDPEEKNALLQAAEYLELPELSDVLAAQKAAGSLALGTNKPPRSAAALSSALPLQHKTLLYRQQQQAGQTAPASQGQ